MLSALTAAMFTMTAWSIGTVAGFAQPEYAWAEDTREISVQVSVVDPDGDPIVNVPLFVYTQNGVQLIRPQHAPTLPVVVGASPTEDSVLCVMLWSGDHRNDLSDAEEQAIESRYEELLSQYAFLNNYSIPLNATYTEYSITINALKRVEISGRFVDNAGLPIEGVVGSVTPYMSLIHSGTDGTFVASAAAGQTAVLQVIHPADESNQIFVLRRTPQQTGQDHNLGDVMIESLPIDSAVEIMFATNQNAVDPADLGTLKLDVTLIRDDGSAIFGYQTNRLQTKAVEATWRVDDLPPQIAAGTYYVVAGSVGTDAARALLRSIEDGRQALLDAAGVPKVTAVPGQTASITINAMDSFNAALSVGADLVD